MRDIQVIGIVNEQSGYLYGGTECLKISGDLETLGAAIKIPTLFIHDTDDLYVAHQDGGRFMSKCRFCRDR